MMELRSNVSFALQNLKETSCATLLKKEKDPLESHSSRQAFSYTDFATGGAQLPALLMFFKEITLVSFSSTFLCTTTRCSTFYKSVRPSSPDRP